MDILETHLDLCNWILCSKTMTTLVVTACPCAACPGPDPPSLIRGQSLSLHLGILVQQQQHGTSMSPCGTVKGVLQEATVALL